MNNLLLTTHTASTGLIFMLGLATVFLSIYSCTKFNRFRKSLTKDAARLTHAVAWQLAGEAVIGFGTLVFATAEFMGWLKGWPWQFTSMLRVVMFAATAVTTLHLVRTISFLSRGES